MRNEFGLRISDCSGNTAKVWRSSVPGNDEERHGLCRWLFASLPNRMSEFLVGIDTVGLANADGLASARPVSIGVTGG